MHNTVKHTAEFFSVSRYSATGISSVQHFALSRDKHLAKKNFKLF